MAPASSLIMSLGIGASEQPATTNAIQKTESATLIGRPLLLPLLLRVPGLVRLIEHIGADRGHVVFGQHILE